MKKGFTLIELLAVIVILAIIALIATPIILGIINDAREKANERSVELYASAVKNGIAAYQLTGLTAPKSFSDLTIEYDGDVVCLTQELYEDGTFYLEGCKVNGSEKEYSYGTKQGSEMVKACTLEDKDGDGVASLNDVVTCGTESFYVIDNNASEITMFAKTFLYAGYNISASDGMTYPIENPTYLQTTENDDLGDYSQVGNAYDATIKYQNNLRGTNLNVTSAIVMHPTVEHLEKLGCVSTTESIDCSSSSYSWINQTESIYVLDNNNNITFKFYNGYGSIDDGSPWVATQPVVIISVSEI